MYQIVLKVLSTTGTRTTYLIHGQEIVREHVSDLTPLKLGDLPDLTPDIVSKSGFAALVVPGAHPSKETVTQVVHQTGAFPADCAVQII